MNILISPYGKGRFRFRSDSTLIRMLTDFYIPDYVESVAAVPILCFRSLRSGKSVPAKFADRYLGPFAGGILLCPTLKQDAVVEEDRIFVENALDYSTIIPYDLIPIERLEDFISDTRPFTVKVNGIQKAGITKVPDRTELYRRFEDISSFCSLRTGDFIAFALSNPIPAGRDERIIAHFGVEGNIGIIVH